VSDWHQIKGQKMALEKRYLLLGSTLCENERRMARSEKSRDA